MRGWGDDACLWPTSRLPTSVFRLPTPYSLLPAVPRARGARAPLCAPQWRGDLISAVARLSVETERKTAIFRLLGTFELSSGAGRAI